MRMDLVSIIGGVGSNVKHNWRQYMVIGFGTLGGAVVLSGCGPSQETRDREKIEYHLEQLKIAEEVRKAEYDAAQLAKIPGLEEQSAANTAAIEEFVTQGAETTAAMGKLGEKVDAQAEYFEKIIDTQAARTAESIDALRRDLDYNPSCATSCHSPHYSTRSLIEEVRRAVRYYFTKEGVKAMRNESGFENIFGNVPSTWVDGRPSGRELRSDDALSINELTGIATFNFTDGAGSNRYAPGYLFEGVVMNQARTNPGILYAITIVESRPVGHP